MQHATAYSMLQVSLGHGAGPERSFALYALILLLPAYSCCRRRQSAAGHRCRAFFALPRCSRFVTLPVEFDASKRALAWMDKRGIVTPQEHAMAKDALWWAAMTYVVAALGSLATLFYYVTLLMGRRRD